MAWTRLVNHNCESHLGEPDADGIYTPSYAESSWGGWEKDANGIAYVYVAEAIYVDGTPLTKDGNQLYYFYYRCEYCGAFYKVGEYSYPETMPIYSTDFATEDNADGLFEVTVDHIAMGWIHIPDAYADMGLTFTDADDEGYVFAVGLYLDEATCAAFAELVKDQSNSQYTDWSNTILFILDGEEGGSEVTFYCFVSIEVDEEGNESWYWEVTVETAAPEAENP